MTVILLIRKMSRTPSRHIMFFNVFFTSFHLISRPKLHVARRRGRPLLPGDYITTNRSPSSSLLCHPSRITCSAISASRFTGGSISAHATAWLHRSPFSHCLIGHNVCFKVLSMPPQSIASKTARWTHSIVHNLSTDVFRTRHNVQPTMR